MAKVFFTYAQQLYKLEYEKGLIINDKQYAEKKLKEISYYSLIGGYKQPFKHGPSGKYVRGVQFEEIVSLYYFDEELRSLFLKYILHVERQIKSQLSYHFCEKYGDLQKEYLDVNNYNNTPNNVAGINKLIGILTSAISLPSNYSYIVHHVNAYGNVPLWVAMNALTFGNVAAMYQYSTSDIRAKVSQKYGCTIYPTIGWALPDTYDIAFGGVEKGGIVVISTLGCQNNKEVFLQGFNEMKTRLEPSLIIVYGEMIEGMTGRFVNFKYSEVFSRDSFQLRIEGISQVFEIKEAA